MTTRREWNESVVPQRLGATSVQLADQSPAERRWIARRLLLAGVPWGEVAALTGLRTGAIQTIVEALHRRERTDPMRGRIIWCETCAAHVAYPRQACLTREAAVE